MNFEKELNEIVEKYVDVTKKQSKAVSIDEFVKDETTIARLKNIYDTRDLLLELYDIDEETQMKAKLKKYGLDKVFDELSNNCYIAYYNFEDDDRIVWIIDDLDLNLPVD